jgi:predicted ATP-grasp superfamily ATP-dependent carboligase
MDFGRFSTFVETVELPEVEELARRLIAARLYTGLIEVEFKFDRRDCRYKLLDLNPRVWGWHTLARRAGVDFPYLTWRLIHGEPVPEVSARPNTRWIRFLPDLSVALRELLRGRMSLAAYLRSLRSPLELAVYAADDPIPALLDVPFQIYRVGNRNSSSPSSVNVGPSLVQHRDSGVRDA